MNSVRSNNLSLKYQRVTTSGFKDIGVSIFKFVAKTQFLMLKRNKMEKLDSSFGLTWLQNTHKLFKVL